MQICSAVTDTSPVGGAPAGGQIRGPSCSAHAQYRSFRYLRTGLFWSYVPKLQVEFRRWNRKRERETYLTAHLHDLRFVRSTPRADTRNGLRFNEIQFESYLSAQYFAIGIMQEEETALIGRMSACSYFESPRTSRRDVIEQWRSDGWPPGWETNLSPLKNFQSANRVDGTHRATFNRETQCKNDNFVSCRRFFAPAASLNPRAKQPSAACTHFWPTPSMPSSKEAAIHGCSNYL